MIEVVCAIIQSENKFLIAQRSEKMSLPLKWEFPGGKVKKEEDKKAALQREILEELEMQIQIIQELTSVVHHYADISITLFPFLCKVKTTNFHKTEHNEIKWETKENLLKYDWAAADIPIVKEVYSL